MRVARVAPDFLSEYSWMQWQFSPTGEVATWPPPIVPAATAAADPRGVKLHIIIVCTSEGHHFTVAWQVSHAQLAANRRVQDLRADVIDDEALMAIPDGVAAAAGPAAGVAGQAPPA
eukprot:3663203-Prymnesium_polylepis.1